MEEEGAKTAKESAATPSAPETEAGGPEGPSDAVNIKTQAAAAAAAPAAAATPPSPAPPAAAGAAAVEDSTEPIAAAVNAESSLENTVDGRKAAQVDGPVNGGGGVSSAAATEDAAKDAAEDAAKDPAKDAAEDAAKHAAKDAAEDAAEDAANGATAGPGNAALAAAGIADASLAAGEAAAADALPSDSMPEGLAADTLPGETVEGAAAAFAEGASATAAGPAEDQSSEVAASAARGTEGIGVEGGEGLTLDAGVAAAAAEMAAYIAAMQMDGPAGDSSEDGGEAQALSPTAAATPAAAAEAAPEEAASPPKGSDAPECKSEVRDATAAEVAASVEGSSAPEAKSGVTAVKEVAQAMAQAAAAAATARAQATTAAEEQKAADLVQLQQQPTSAETLGSAAPSTVVSTAAGECVAAETSPLPAPSLAGVSAATGAAQMPPDGAVVATSSDSLEASPDTTSLSPVVDAGAATLPPAPEMSAAAAAAEAPAAKATAAAAATEAAEAPAATSTTAAAAATPAGVAAEAGVTAAAAGGAAAAGAAEAATAEAATEAAATTTAVEPAASAAPAEATPATPTKQSQLSSPTLSTTPPWTRGPSSNNPSNFKAVGIAARLSAPSLGAAGLRSTGGAWVGGTAALGPTSPAPASPAKSASWVRPTSGGSGVVASPSGRVGGGGGGFNRGAAAGPKITPAQQAEKAAAAAAAAAAAQAAAVAAAEKAAASFTVGSRVWVQDPEETFVEGEVVKIEGGYVELNVTGRRGPHAHLRVLATECFAKEDEGGIVDDMTKLAHLHEPGVLHNLHQRYQCNLIYTYTGSILIAVNPFVRLPALYHPVMKAQYRGAHIGELAPHVFAIADHAYRSMVDEQRSQSILISGESGAGKTETTKLVMEYLAGAGDAGGAGEAGLSAAEEERIALQRRCVSRVLESNQVLETFGNAKTVRNNNSSRFGKFIEIHFDGNGAVSGAAIRSYLLERSRVVQIASPERSYHCFYQLLYGATPEEAEAYKLPTSGERGTQFHYLNQSDCFELPGGVKNSEEYRHTRKAMDVMGFSLQEQDGIFRVLAAILHLGNVRFSTGNPADDDKDGSGGEPLKPADEQSEFHLSTVADLLRCDVEALQKSLVTITRKVGREIIASPLSAKAAQAKRDTLAKTLYSKLFDWIIDKVNVSIGQDPDCRTLIGVLDIYGFEHFKVNSFEQFCINLANEKLQQHFNAHVLKMEQEEYEKEEIDWSYIDFTDNQDVLDLIEGPRGILGELDSACKLGSSTPEAFSQRLYTVFADNDRFTKSKMSRTDFTINHYAGQVKYETDEFLVKNMDAVVPEHEALLCASADPFVAALFPPTEASSGSAKFVSLGRRFKEQLALLMRTLNETEPHYIRCVKPNTELKPNLFNKHLVMDQLRSGGVLEAVRVCSKGYPTRRTFEDFIERFSLLIPGLEEQDMSDEEMVAAILKKAELESWQIGLTKVFLRAGQMVVLETLRLNRMNEAARAIQRSLRLFLFRIHRQRATLAIQKHWRAFVARRMLRAMRELRATVLIQKCVRRWLQRMRFLQLRAAQVMVAAAFRAWYMRRRYIAMRRDLAATRIQKVWRGYWFRKPWRALKSRLQIRVAQRRLTRAKEAAARAALLAPPRTKVEASLEQLRMQVLRIMKLKEEKKRVAAEEKIKEMHAELDAKTKEIHRLNAQIKEEQQKTLKAEEELKALMAAGPLLGGGGGALGYKAAVPQYPVVNPPPPTPSRKSPLTVFSRGTLGSIKEREQDQQQQEQQQQWSEAAGKPPSTLSLSSSPAPAGDLGGGEGGAETSHTSSHKGAPLHSYSFAGALTKSPLVAAHGSSGTRSLTSSPSTGGAGAVTVGRTGGAGRSQVLARVLALRGEGVVSVAASTGGEGGRQAGVGSLASQSVASPPTTEAGSRREIIAGGLSGTGGLRRPRTAGDSGRPGGASRGGAAGAAAASAAAATAMMGSPSSFSRMVGQLTILADEVKALKAERQRAVDELEAQKSLSKSIGERLEEYAGTLKSNEFLIQELLGKNNTLQQKLREKEEELRQLSCHLLEAKAGAAHTEHPAGSPAAASPAAAAATAVASAAAQGLEGPVADVPLAIATPGGVVAAEAAAAASASSTASSPSAAAAAGTVAVSPQGSDGAEMDRRSIMKLEDRLLDLLTSNTTYGFTPEGYPVAACTMYRALAHWKTLEAARTNAFDKITESLQAASHTGSLQQLAYWLTNTATLLFLLETVHAERQRQAMVEAKKRESASAAPRQKSTTATSAAAGGWFGWGVAVMAAVATEEMPRGGGSAAKVDAVDLTMFKFQLTTSIERIYVTIRDSINDELQGHFAGGHSGQTPRKGVTPQSPGMGSFNRRGGGGPASVFGNGGGGGSGNSSTGSTGGRRGSKGSGGDRNLPRSAGSMRRQMLDYWNSVMVTLRQMVDALLLNHVPHFLVLHLLKQLLSYVDLRIFNSLMVRSQWCPCTFSNGETIMEGLGRLDKWLQDAAEVLATPATDSAPAVTPSDAYTSLQEALCHIRQAAQLLTMENKHERSVEDVVKACPDLNGKQLGKICVGYRDEIYGTPGFDEMSVQYELTDLADDDDPEMLKDDESIPFAVGELISTMQPIHLEVVPPPPELRGDPNFRFLTPVSAATAAIAATAAAATPGAGTPPALSLQSISTQSPRSLMPPLLKL